jgi:hypothetical protein
LIEKIQEISAILQQKVKVGEDIKTYRVFEGEVSLVEEIASTFITNKTVETT